jgi:4-amino-4-deoxy-L-arabinose transferase-like glycosyltransferase
METMLAPNTERSEPTTLWASDTAWLVGLALATVVIHLLVGNRYGFHRDELQTLEDARYLDWGFVAYPPVTALFARLSLTLFGTSLVGFRLFASLANAVSIVMTGLIAKEMGGGRRAQLAAALAAMPFCLVAGSMMQYVSFDYLWWVLIAYFVVRLVRSNNPRWWVAIGATIGVGMETKYTMGVLALAVAGGTVLTPLRKHLRSKWLWIGVALSLVIFLPNALWQWQNHFISLDFLRHIHERDVRIGRTKDFLPDQIKLTLFALPLALAGLWYSFFSAQGRRFRIFGWMYVVALAIFVVAKGRGYYLAAGYPMLFAAGSIWAEQKLVTMRAWSRRTIEGFAWTALLVNTVVVIAFTLPIAAIGSDWFKKAADVNGDLVEEIGWPELVGTVARVRDGLSPQERERLGVLAGNYGEAGALNVYGPEHGLPRAISGTNSFWFRGFGNPAPKTVIVVGIGRDFLDEHFTGCRMAAEKISNPYDVRNEESERHPDIYVCGPPKRGWETFWKSEFPWFG